MAQFIPLTTIVGMARRHTLAVPYVDGLIEWLQSRSLHSIVHEREEVFASEELKQTRARQTGRMAIIVQLTDVIATEPLSSADVISRLWDHPAVAQRRMLATASTSVVVSAGHLAHELLDWMLTHGYQFWETRPSTFGGCRWAVEFKPGEQLVFIELEISAAEAAELAAAMEA